MNIKIFSILLVATLCLNSAVPQRAMKKANKEISKFYEIDDFTKSILVISDENNQATPSNFGTDNFFKIMQNETFIGYAYIGNAPSKTATFDYLVLFDKDFIVTKSKVLIYREEYGGEIGSKRWLKQFIGKKEGDNVLHGQDIIAIAGATISTTSMTRAMNNLFESLKILNSKDAL
jgi:Na+-translocating ferredoxin:NAD+ oxidoreductase RnfG subunit